MNNDRRIEREIARLAGMNFSNGGMVNGDFVTLAYTSDPTHLYTIPLPCFLTDTGALFRHVIHPAWNIEMKGISAFVSAEINSKFYQGVAHSNVRSRALALAVYALQQKLDAAGVLIAKPAHTGATWDAVPGTPVRLKGTRLSGVIHDILVAGVVLVEFKDADRVVIDDYNITDLEPA